MLLAQGVRGDFYYLCWRPPQNTEKQQQHTAPRLAWQPSEAASPRSCPPTACCPDALPLPSGKEASKGGFLFWLKKKKSIQGQGSQTEGKEI